MLSADKKKKLEEEERLKKGDVIYKEGYKEELLQGEKKGVLTDIKDTLASKVQKGAEKIKEKIHESTAPSLPEAALETVHDATK